MLLRSLQEEDKARRKAELTEEYEGKMAAKQAEKEQQEAEDEGTGRVPCVPT